MHFIILFAAKYLYLVVCLLAAIYWLRAPRSQKLRLAVYGAVTAIVAFILVKIGGALYYDPRPFVSHHVAPIYPHDPTNGFPSDHTVFTAFIAFTVFSASRRWGAVLLGLAVLVGAGRVLGRIHSPIDIIGGLVFAAIGSLAAYYATPPILAFIRKQRKRQPEA